MKVFIAQFMKAGDYSETRALKRFSDLITLVQFGTGKFIVDKPAPEDIRAAREGLSRTRSIIAAGVHDLVILEEANVAVKYGLFTARDLFDIIDTKPDHVELVITGRYADPGIIERADLVTEMKDIKHYFNRGVDARVGIEK